MGQPKRLYVIAANTVVHTGRVSFKFEFESGAPLKSIRQFDAFGVVDQRSVFYVFNTAEGQIYTSGNGLPFWDRVAHCPEAVLLTDRLEALRIECACNGLGLECEVFYFDGELSTS